MYAQVGMMDDHHLYARARNTTCQDRHWLAREFPEIVQPAPSGTAHGTRPGADDEGEVSQAVEAGGKNEYSVSVSSHTVVCLTTN